MPALTFQQLQQKLSRYAFEAGREIIPAGGCHWRTLGAQVGEDGEKHGGHPVCIKGSEIVKGPKELMGKNPAHPGKAGPQLHGEAPPPAEGTGLEPEPQMSSPLGQQPKEDHFAAAKELADKFQQQGDLSDMEMLEWDHHMAQLSGQPAPTPAVAAPVDNQAAKDVLKQFWKAGAGEDHKAADALWSQWKQMSEGMTPDQTEALVAEAVGEYNASLKPPAEQAPPGPPKDAPPEATAGAPAPPEEGTEPGAQGAEMEAAQQAEKKPEAGPAPDSPKGKLEAAKKAWKAYIDASMAGADEAYKAWTKAKQGLSDAAHAHITGENKPEPPEDQILQPTGDEEDPNYANAKALAEWHLDHGDLTVDQNGVFDWKNKQAMESWVQAVNDMGLTDDQKHQLKVDLMKKAKAGQPKEEAKPEAKPADQSHEEKKKQFEKAKQLWESLKKSKPDSAEEAALQKRWDLAKEKLTGAEKLHITMPTQFGNPYNKADPYGEKAAKAANTPEGQAKPKATAFKSAEGKTEFDKKWPSKHAEYLKAAKPSDIEPSWGSDPKGSWGGVITDGKGKYLLRKVAGGYNSTKWSWAKGQSNTGDHPLTAATREVLEETGHNAEAVGAVPGLFKGTGSDTRYFLMKSTGDTGKHDKETEETKWVTYDEAKKLLSETPNETVRRRDLSVLDAAHQVATARDVPKGHPEDLKGLKDVKALGGESGAKLMQDAKGNKFVHKTGNNPGHVREEYTAEKMYSALGVRTPESHLYEEGGKPVKLSKWMDDLTPLHDLKGEKRLEAEERAKQNFVADALMANWDVVGPKEDNLMVDKNGNLVHIDVGGSLRYGGFGGSKGDKFTDHVDELWTMRDKSINPGTSKVFTYLTPHHLAEQIDKVLSKRDALLAATPYELKEKMRNRLDSLSRAGFVYKEGAKAGWSNEEIEKKARAAAKAPGYGDRHNPKDAEWRAEISPELPADTPKAKVTPDHLKAIDHWAGTSRFIAALDYTGNSNYKGGEYTPEQLERLHKDIYDAYQKLPKYKGWIHRGLHSVPFKQLDGVMPGDEIELDAMASFTRSPEVADGFASGGSDPNKANVVLRVNAKSARSIEGYGGLGGEREIIAGKGFGFRVTKAYWGSIKGATRFIIEGEETTEAVKKPRKVVKGEGYQHHEVERSLAPRRLREESKKQGVAFAAEPTLKPQPQEPKKSSPFIDLEGSKYINIKKKAGVPVPKGQRSW